MKINKLIEKLEQIAKENGNVEIMFEEPNDGRVYSIDNVDYRVAEKGEFPSYYKMPAGFKFGLISN